MRHARSWVAAGMMIAALAGSAGAQAGSNNMTAGKTESKAANPMALGVDDAGKRRHIYDDPSMREAFQQIGFDFLMHHIYGEPRVADVDQLNRWAAETGHDYILNQENTTRPRGPEGIFRRPGLFFQPSAAYIERARSSSHFLGICYDEAEHWATDGVWITGGAPRGTSPGFQPHFYDANGDTLEEAYEGNLANLIALLKTCYPGFADATTRPAGAPIVTTEHVFPIFFHLFARAGIAPIPKYMKETVTPVAAAVALGAAKEYGTEYWACLDLWGPSGNYPFHTPQELKSSMLFAYWTGCDKAYVENFSFHNSLYAVTDGQVQLNTYGQMAQWFKRTYMPQNPRTIRHADFAPEIIIVRFPDSDWGQQQRSYIRENLYGADNLKPDAQTRYWCRIWNVISHGQIPTQGLTWHAGYTIPYRFFFPANNVAVYDHLAAKPELYRSARLVFLTGKKISPECMATLRSLVEKGLTVVSPSHLAPAGMTVDSNAAYKEYKTGAGRWIITDDVTQPQVRTLLQPYLGKPDELRYVFGNQEVIFTAPEDYGQLQVTVRPLPAK